MAHHRVLVLTAPKPSPFAVYGLVVAHQARRRRRAPGRQGRTWKASASLGRAIVSSAPALPRHRDHRPWRCCGWAWPYPGGQPAKVGFTCCTTPSSGAEALHPQPSPAWTASNSHVLPHRSRHRHPVVFLAWRPVNMLWPAVTKVNLSTYLYMLHRGQCLFGCPSRMLFSVPLPASSIRPRRRWRCWRGCHLRRLPPVNPVVVWSHRGRGLHAPFHPRDAAWRAPVWDCSTSFGSSTLLLHHDGGHGNPIGWMALDALRVPHSGRTSAGPGSLVSRLRRFRVLPDEGGVSRACLPARPRALSFALLWSGMRSCKPVGCLAALRRLALSPWQDASSCRRRPVGSAGVSCWWHWRPHARPCSSLHL